MDKRIDEIKDKINYLSNKKKIIKKDNTLDLDDLELIKLYKKLRRKKKFNLEDKQTNDEIDNYKIDFIFNPISDYYGPFIKNSLSPHLIGILISFIGGYLLFSFNILLGLSFIILSYLLVPFLNCLEDRYLIFTKDVSELKKFQKFILTDNDNQLDVDQIWFTKEELLFLQSSLPWYLSEAEIESATWLNSIIEVIWLQIHKQFNNWLDINFNKNRSLNSLIGNGNYLLDLRITRSSLGNKAPYISGIRVIKRGVKKENAILECELTFDSNLNLQIEDNFNLLKFGIEKFYFRSKLRIVAGPLFREIPAIGSILISLIERPSIDWKFTGCLKVLNFKFIKKSVSFFLNYWLGQPLKSKLNIAKFLPLRELILRDPIELIKVDLIEVINLPRGQMKICCQTKKSNIYCLVSIDNDEKTTNLKQHSDLEWNQTLMFFIFEKRKQTLIEIYVYEEQSEEDELIGYVELSTEYFKSDKSEYNGREFEIELLDPETKNPLKYGQTKLVFRITCFRLVNELHKMQKSLELSKNLLPVATLSVLVDSASGIETVVHQVQTPELRILVRITVGNQTQVTSIKERTGYPVFEEDVYVEIVDMYWIMEKRVFAILGDKKNDLEGNLANISNEGLVLGYTTIRTTDVLNSFQMRKQGTFQLEGYSEEAYIRLLLTIRLTELTQQIYTNQSQPRMQFLLNKDNLNKLKKSISIDQTPKLINRNVLKNIKK